MLGRQVAGAFEGKTTSQYFAFSILLLSHCGKSKVRETEANWIDGKSGKGRGNRERKLRVGRKE